MPLLGSHISPSSSPPGLVPDRLASLSGAMGSVTLSAVWSNGTSISAQTHLCPVGGTVGGPCGIEVTVGVLVSVLPSASWEL